MNDRETLVSASWLAPMDGSVVRDGGMIVAGGRIRALGDAAALAGSHPDAEELRFAGSLIIPGLVNPHVHLELSACPAGESPEGDFGDWILNLRSRMKLPGDSLIDAISESAKIGIGQCRRFGVTTVGDISQHSQITRPLLRDTTLRCVSYGETLGLGAMRWRYDELLQMALQPERGSERLRIGLTPHAPYTVDEPGYRQCLQVARDRDWPLATHLAETNEERAFLEDHEGMFRRVWESLGMWSDDVPTYKGGPVEMADALGLLSYPTLLAHVNYCDDGDLELLSRGTASVVYCPRTHRYFGHPPHRWREMMARGINVAVGTDSCASSPDLNIVDDLRLLRQIAPELDAQTIWELATIRAARAVRLDADVGSLTPGKYADFVVFETDALDPMESVLRDPRLPAHVHLAGARV